MSRVASQDRVAGKVALAACLVFLGAAIPSAVAGQTCAWSAHVGVGVPLRQLPPRDSPRGEVRTGAGFGVGRQCGAEVGSSHGFTATLFDYHRLQTVYLLAEFGQRSSVGAGQRAPWVHVKGRAGLAGAFDLGTESLILIPGRKTKLPSLGLAFGFGLGLGLPLGRGAVVLDATLLTTFLETHLVGSGGDRSGGGFTTLVSVPVSIGYRFAF